MNRFLLVLGLLLISCATSKVWMFDKPASALVMTQRRVIEKTQSINFVLHDKDGDWQFLTTEYSPMDEAVELPFEQIVAIDSTLTQVAQLSRGWKATRQDRQSSWIFAKYR